MSIHVQLERFEGPHGLLLHLIREQEMDIFNINIHQITRQYFEYIKAMRRLDLEVAGEFVAMAATLIHIKSRMLLPQYNEEGEEIQEDPRKELVQKLLEYQKIKELSQQLYKLPLLGRDVFRRGEREEIESLEEGELVLEENPLFSLIAAYRTAIKNMKKTVHRVVGELQSIAARILEMKEMFVVGRRLVFGELITDKQNPGNQVLVTFLSLLELAKMGFISVFQSEPFADIHIEPKRSIDRDIVSQVENYESVNAAEKADAIMSEAQQQLSLEESAGVLPEDEAGDQPVVQESFADAATDADIEAEEQRMLAEDLGSPVEVAAEAGPEPVAEAPTEEHLLPDLKTEPTMESALAAIKEEAQAAPASVEPTGEVASVTHAAEAAAAAFAFLSEPAPAEPPLPPTEPSKPEVES